MRLSGNRSKRWSSYIIIALTVAAAWLTRNRPLYRSRSPYATDTRYGTTRSSTAGKAQVYTTDRARAAATATAATAGAARVYDRAEDPSPYLTRRLDDDQADRYRHRRRAVWWLLPLLLIPFLVCLVAWLVARNGGVDDTPSTTSAAVQVDGQPAGNTVTVDRVTAPQNGWVALYRTNANGQPDLSAPVGVAPVGSGESTDVVVPLDQPVAPADQLAAVLHADNGAAGVFEPNGADPPTQANGSVVASTFAIGAAAAAAAADGGTNAQGSEPPPLPPSPTQVAASTSTPSDAATSPAASSSVAGGNGTGAEQSATAAANSATSTADPNAGTAAVAGSATGEAATPVLDPATGVAGTAAAVDTATAQANEASADATPNATGDAPSSVAAASDPATTAALDPTNEAATAVTNEAATAAAGDTATAPAAAGGDVATPDTTAPTLNVGANDALIGAAQQAAGSESVTLDRVVAPQNGWVAITRANPDGTPNFDDVLGVAPVQVGQNTNVQVPLTEAPGADGAVAVLLADGGVTGVFEPNGADLPVAAGGALVTADIAGSAAAATALDQTAVPFADVQATSDTATTSDTTTTTPQTTPEPAAATGAASSAVPAATATTGATDATAQAEITAAAPEPTATAEPTGTVEPTQTVTATAVLGTATAQATATAAAPTSTPTIAPSATPAVEPMATLAPTSTIVPTLTASDPSASGSSAAAQPSIAATPSAPPSAGAAVNNATQAGDTVLIDQVTSPQNGWVVLQRADANGQPIADAVVGAAPVQAGASSDVQVPLTASLASGDTIVVLVYADAGVGGTFEPAGPDTLLSDANTAPVITVAALEQLPETGTLAGWWMLAFVGALVACAAGVLLRQHLVR